MISRSYILFLVSTIAALIAAVFPMATYAITEWEIVPKESSLTFTGIQNNAPVSGSFKNFKGTIAFDPEKLSESKVNVLVDTRSINTPYEELTSTLQTSDWFNVKSYPDASFTATRFIKISNDTFEADGMLKIRDKTQPISITFTSENLSNDKVRVKGSTDLKRTAFGVGQGEWADTKEIKDDVKVEFILTAIKK